MILILYIFLGILGGILSGLFGIGGGIILVPALVLLFKFSQQTAQGITLAMLLPPIGIFAVWEYYKKGFVDIKISLLLAAGFMIGSFLSSKVAVSIPSAPLEKFFGILLLVIGIKFLFFPK